MRILGLMGRRGKQTFIEVPWIDLAAPPTRSHVTCLSVLPTYYVHGSTQAQDFPGLIFNHLRYLHHSCPHTTVITKKKNLKRRKSTWFIPRAIPSPLATKILPMYSFVSCSRPTMDSLQLGLLPRNLLLRPEERIVDVQSKRIARHWRSVHAQASRI